MVIHRLLVLVLLIAAAPQAAEVSLRAAESFHAGLMVATRSRGLDLRYDGGLASSGGGLEPAAHPGEWSLLKPVPEGGLRRLDDTVVIFALAADLADVDGTLTLEGEKLGFHVLDGRRRRIRRDPIQMLGMTGSDFIASIDWGNKRQSGKDAAK